MFLEFMYISGALCVLLLYFYENELNLVMMCRLETGFGELDGTYIFTLLGNTAIGVEKSLEMESMLNEILLNIFNRYKLDSLIPSLSFTHTHTCIHVRISMYICLFVLVYR